MIPDAEKLLRELLENDLQIRDVYETHRKIHNDPRITKIGIFLRKTSLDELPQLINVIKGEMSLVGPRPILLDEEEVYGKGQLRFYYAIRPGLTGLWQVSGRNNMTFAQRVNLDMKYIQNWSLWYDFIIFIRTFAVIISRSGAY
jgi:undecaprenyl-phosphate galactose phosphotransferase